MTSTSAKIAAAALKDSGVTPSLAGKMWEHLGSQHIALVDLAVAERSEGTDDTRGVKLVVVDIEPAVDSDTAEHMRELLRALYMRRQPDPALTAGVESTPRDVVIRGQVEVLHCEHCEHSLGSKHINHARRTGVACIYAPCRHTVVEGADRCPCATGWLIALTGGDDR